MKTAYLFPGQGSQFVGMSRDLYDSEPAARRVFDEADEVLGMSLSSICFEGPDEVLKETRNTQPAIFVHSLAVLATLGWRLEREDALLAGHSLGEYTAYVAAGSLTFADGLRLVRRRGELMFAEGLERPGAMAAILGLTAEAVEAVLETIDGVVVPANYNSPTQLVISGEIPAVVSAMEKLKEAGAKRVLRLGVSGAFHSPLLKSAAEGLSEALKGVTILPARSTVLANETAAPVQEPEEIRASLARQILSPVRWEPTVRRMLDEGATRFIEIGPGKVLSGLVRAVKKDVDHYAIGTAEQTTAHRGLMEGCV